MKNEDANGLRSRKETLTCRSYLENIVDSLMVMIYAVSINLRRFNEVSMSNDLPKEATTPSLLYNKRQPYQICCIMRKEQMLQKNSKMRSQITLILMKTP